MRRTQTPKPADAATPAFSIAEAPILRSADLRDGGEYRAKAKEMEVGDAVANMPQAAAGKLSRAIEELHGARTSTQRKKDGSYTVQRVEPRPLRTRKPKAVAE